MTNYFENCKNNEELKATYKELVKKFHPDVYGEKGNDILKDIHNQLEKALKNIDKKTYDALYNDEDREESEEIRIKKENIAKEMVKKHKGLAYQFLFVAYWENHLRASNHRNPLTKHNFTGWNVWQLELKMLLQWYKSAKWSTFAQCRDAKNSIKKGEHGAYITLAIISKAKNENGEEDETKTRIFYKGYTVFNEEQTQNGTSSEEKAPAQIQEVKQIETKLNLDPEKIEKAKESHNEVKKIFEKASKTIQKTLNLWDTCEVVA